MAKKKRAPRTVKQDIVHKAEGRRRSLRRQLDELASEFNRARQKLLDKIAYQDEIIRSVGGKADD